MDSSEELDCSLITEPSLQEIDFIEGFENALVGLTADFGPGTAKAVYDVNKFVSIFSLMHCCSEKEATVAVSYLISQNEGGHSAPIFMFLGGEECRNPTDNMPIGWVGFLHSH